VLIFGKSSAKGGWQSILISCINTDHFFVDEVAVVADLIQWLITLELFDILFEELVAV